MGWAEESVKSCNSFGEEDGECKRFRGNSSGSPGVAGDLSLPGLSHDWAENDIEFVISTV